MILLLHSWGFNPSWAQMSQPPSPLTSEMISVETDKTQYATGEIIKVVVSNKSSARLRVDSYTSLRCSIQKLEKGDWQIVPLVACSCGKVMCNMPEIYLEPQQFYEFTWTQRTSWCAGSEMKTAFVKPGAYRVLCPLSASSARDDKITVVSKEFLIGS